MEQDLQISFDKENKIRLLDPQKSSELHELATECQNFTEKVEQFSGNPTIRFYYTLNDHQIL